jgi:four helix bundle protein
VNYEEWEKTVPEVIRGDSLWKMTAYRLALFLGDLGWHDVTRLAQDRRTWGVSDQLYRALGSISANLAEGYSRGTGRDRARFYEYALGSARESRDWYYKGRHVLGDAVAQHRVELVTRVIQLLLVAVPQQRQSVLKEASTSYQVGADADIHDELLAALLRNVPLPDLDSYVLTPDA